jgi:hypothetical protein
VVEFDYGVVAVAVSPGNADAEAEGGGAGEEGGFGGFSATLAGGPGDGVEEDGFFRDWCGSELWVCSRIIKRRSQWAAPKGDAPLEIDGEETKVPFDFPLGYARGFGRTGQALAVLGMTNRTENGDEVRGRNTNGADQNGPRRCFCPICPEYQIGRG